MLASRQGLPISLAVLHAVVGTSAGLDIEPVNLPGHVINRARVAADEATTGQSVEWTRSQTGGTGINGGGFVYIDVFDGGIILDNHGLK